MNEIMSSINVYAFSATTKGGFPACKKKEWISDMQDFVAAKDKASFNSYIVSEKCIIIKDGLKVTVTESPGMFGSEVGFVFNGVKLWTVRSALNY